MNVTRYLIVGQSGQMTGQDYAKPSHISVVRAVIFIRLFSLHAEFFFPALHVCNKPDVSPSLDVMKCRVTSDVIKGGEADIYDLQK